MSSFATREVTDAGDLERVYRLRYRVYVEQMGRRPHYADARARRLFEPLDRSALQIAAFDTGSQALAGALRIHFSDQGGFPEFAELWGLPLDGLAEPAMIVTRLVTLPEARGGAGSVGIQLARAAHRVALAASIRRVFIDCHATLVPFFEWLGFDLVHGFEHADYGEISVMAGDPRGRTRLARTASPLLPVLDEALETLDTADAPVASDTQERRPEDVQA